MARWNDILWHGKFGRSQPTSFDIAIKETWTKTWGLEFHLVWTWCIPKKIWVQVREKTWKLHKRDGAASNIFLNSCDKPSYIQHLAMLHHIWRVFEGILPIDPGGLPSKKALHQWLVLGIRAPRGVCQCIRNCLILYGWLFDEGRDPHAVS